MTKDEIVQAVRRIIDADGTESELEGLLALVEQNVPHPSVSDLIFYPPNGIELSAEEIVNAALAYQPIGLGRSAREEK
jgi:hypothetical protein